jgi:hypothetical protein
MKTLTLVILMTVGYTAGIVVGLLIHLLRA